MTEFIKILGKGLLIALGLSIIGLLIWRYNINSLNLEQQKDVSDIIKKTIEFESQKGKLLPELVFIEADSSKKRELTDSLLTQITSVLTEKYVYNRKLSTKDISLKPFFVLTNKPDSTGNYIITENQLNDLKAHIGFLTNQVQIEVDRTKEEVGRDIDRLNTWVSIWIGVIGFLGIFIPILLNIDISKQASEAKEEASRAKVNSEQARTDTDTAIQEAKKALQKINDAQPQIDKIDGLENKVKDVEAKSELAHTNAETAINDTIEVKRNLSVIIAINRLKEFNPQTIIQLDKDKVLPFYIGMLKGILEELKENAEQFDSELMKNWLGQIAIINQNISLYRFINPEQTRLLNQYSELITNALDSYDETEFKKIVDGLEQLIENLQK